MDGRRRRRERTRRLGPPLAERATTPPARPLRTRRRVPLAAREQPARLTLPLDARQVAWLHDSGEPVLALRGLLDQAIREDIVACALRDERAVELRIRRRHTQLLLRAREHGDASEARAALRGTAETEVLVECEAVHDPALHAAAARVRLRLAIEQGRAANSAAAKAELQRLREQRPGGWREASRRRRVSRPV